MHFKRQYIFISALKFCLLSIFLLLSSHILHAIPGQYFVQFKDKSATEHSLAQPEIFLSPIAIERKSRFNISIDSLDLPVAFTYKDSVRKITSARIMFEVKWLNGIVIDVKDSGKTEALDQLGFVKKIELVRPANAGPGKNNSTKSEVDFYSLTYGHTQLEYGHSFRQIAIHNGHDLHEMGYTGKDLIIAVIDAGFENVDQLYAFEDMRNKGGILSTFDLYRGNDSVYDLHEHGMHVLSIMSGYIPDQLKGTAPDASYILLRSEDVNNEYRIEEYAWVAAAEYADSAGADIINSSLGYSTFDDTKMNYSYEDMDGKTAIVTFGAEIAASKGILVVSSAGNQAELPWQYITAPADGENVFTVGAVNRQAERALFSSTGPASDGRIKPNVMAIGEGTSVASRTDGNVFNSGRGTSFSAPVISGLMACLWQAFPELSNLELMDAVEKSAHLFNDPNNEYGYGIPNFYLAYNQLKGNDYRDFSHNLQILNIFPNPFSDHIKIYFFAKEDIQFEFVLSDMTGRIILKEEFNIMGNSFSFVEPEGFATLATGVYLIRIIENEEVFIQKIIKS